MKIIPPSFEILDMAPGDEILKKIELAGRVCYKSEDKITEDSAKDFVRRIIKSGHESVLEHASATAKIICDRGVSHELCRHRIASYSQECVAGDTIVHKNRFTIKQLYDFQYARSHDKTRLKNMDLRSVDFSGRITRNKLVRIIKRNKPANIFEVTTNQGYKIKCTEDHKFMIQNGDFIRLKDLSIGDYVMVNGRPCLLKINDNVLSDLYLDKGLSPLEISEICDAPYRSVLRRLQSLNIFESHKNDKNKEKYNKNHTSASVEKMRLAILLGYQNGRSVWNKGLREEDDPRVKRQGDALRAHHYTQPCGKANHQYKNGISSYRRQKNTVICCELCGVADQRLEVHHIDHNRENNEIDNLIKVCTKCHHVLHHGWHVATFTVPDFIKSIVPIGIEEVYDIEMEAPLHNYIANGFVVHNSSRYCNYSDDKFGKEITVIKPSFWQGCLFDDKCAIWHTAMSSAEKAYFQLIEEGASPQEARCVLPNSLKTEVVITANMREWRHIFKLRCDNAAHPQMREIMRPLLNEMFDRVPVLFCDIYEYGLDNGWYQS